MPLMREMPGVAEHIPKPSEWDRCEIAALREAHRAILEIFALPAFAEGPRYHREDWQRITNKLGDGNGGFDIDLIEDVAGLHFQRVAMKAVHQQLWTDAVNDEALPDQTRARLRCAAQPGAHAWRTIEAVRPHQAWQAGNAMSDPEFMYAMLRMLGQPVGAVTEETRCECALQSVPGPLGFAARVENRPHVTLMWHLCALHWDSCPHGGQGARGPRTARHNSANAHIARGLDLLGARGTERKEVIIRERPLAKGDIFGRNWLSGEGTFVGDGTIWSPMRIGLLRRVARGRLDFTDLGEKMKRKEKEAACKSRGWAFYPFAMSTFGGFGRWMYEHFTNGLNGFDKKREEAKKKGEPEWKVIQEKKHLYEDISSAVQRGNYEMFVESACGETGGALRRVPAAEAEEMQQQRD